MATTGGPSTPGIRFDDESITRQKVRRGTARKVLPFARPYRWLLGLLLLTTAADAVIAVASPLMLKLVIDDGIIPGNSGKVLWLCGITAGLAAADAVLLFVQSWASSRVGEGLIYDLRTQVFEHVQRQPVAFFTRAQTGALVSRLNNDVIGARQALTQLLVTSVSAVLTLVLVLVALFSLSWQITLAALAMVPVFLIPVRLLSGRLQRLTRETMQLDAEMSSMMNERFNVSGALLAKLYGRPESESGLFAAKAGRVRDIAAAQSVYSRVLFIFVSFLTALITALVYGLGGVLAVHGTLDIGTLTAMAALLLRMYQPINQLSTLQVSWMTAMISFDRLFEVLALEPLVAERPDAVALPRARTRAAGPDGPGEAGATPVPVPAPVPAPDIEFADVAFRYPSAREVSLASLETVAARGPERDGDGDSWTLRELSFHAPAGRLTALVGPSGAGKTTITQLATRLYDPNAGTVSVAGHDIRGLTFASLRETIGVVTQEAHLFHDTLRSNLEYARPQASDEEIAEACDAALIWDTVQALPDGLDTVVGDRGYRLSGGEKQRIALARLLLKAPPVVVLDEATAHLDSESEAAVQRALKTVLAGRTSLVIAHRLSTVRDADQILVVDGGRIRERGTHEELLAARGMYADLYQTQFAHQTPDAARQEALRG